MDDCVSIPTRKCECLAASTSLSKNGKNYRILIKIEIGLFSIYKYILIYILFLKF